MSDADPRRAGAVLEIDALARDPRRIDGIELDELRARRSTGRAWERLEGRAAIGARDHAVSRDEVKAVGVARIHGERGSERCVERGARKREPRRPVIVAANDPIPGGLPIGGVDAMRRGGCLRAFSSFGREGPGGGGGAAKRDPGRAVCEASVFRGIRDDPGGDRGIIVIDYP